MPFRSLYKVMGRKSRDVKSGCPPAVTMPWKLNETMKKSEKRILTAACGVKCGAKLIERQGLPVGRYSKPASALCIKKIKQSPCKDLGNEVYRTIQKEVEVLLEEKFWEEMI